MLMLICYVMLLIILLRILLNSVKDEVSNTLQHLMMILRKENYRETVNVNYV